MLTAVPVTCVPDPTRPSPLGGSDGQRDPTAVYFFHTALYMYLHFAAGWAFVLLQQRETCFWLRGAVVLW